jgi:hypothetical protein
MMKRDAVPTSRDSYKFGRFITCERKCFLQVKQLRRLIGIYDEFDLG